MADRYIIPRRLDDPELIGFWTIDEFAGMIDPLHLGDPGAAYLYRHRISPLAPGSHCERQKQDALGSG
jgi:hypothetical protein